MMKKHEKYTDILFKIATDTTPVGSARIAACIVIKNKIIAFGTNRRKTHPLQAKYGRNKDSIWLHAEIDAIVNALRIITVDELKKATLYVCRAKFDSSNKEKFIFGSSRPCKGCMEAIDNFNIKNIIYSDEDGYNIL